MWKFHHEARTNLEGNLGAERRSLNWKRTAVFYLARVRLWGVLFVLGWSRYEQLQSTHGGTRVHLSSSSLCRQPRNEAALGFCSWLKDPQLKKCKEDPLLGLTARDGVELGLKQCRSQFTDRRWNCSGVTIADVFRRERMLKTSKLRMI